MASVTNEAYHLWRQKNTNTRPNLDAVKLLNVRRDIVKNKRLTDVEINNIRAKIQHLTDPLLNSQNQVNAEMDKHDNTKKENERNKDQSIASVELLSQDQMKRAPQPFS